MTTARKNHSQRGFANESASKASQVECLARKAGLNPTTVRRWVRDETQPGIPELDALLDTLQMKPSDRMIALSLLDVPRALTTLKRRQQESADHCQKGILSSVMPHHGRLWRALRMRCGFSTEKVAKHLNLSVSMVWRWETAAIEPLPHHMEALLTLYEAAIPEREALTHYKDRFRAIQGATLPSLDSCEAELHLLLEAVDTEVPLFGDLRFLALEASLWSYAVRRPSVQQLLAYAYNGHCEWLLRRGRMQEMGEYAQRTIKMTPKVKTPNGDWLLGVGQRAKDAAERGWNPKRAWNILETSLSVAQQVGCETNFWRDMAWYACCCHEFGTALTFIENACNTARQYGQVSEERLAQNVHAEILLETGQPQQALRLLQEEPGCPNQQVFCAFRWAKTLLAVGSTQEAAVHVARAHRLITTHDLRHLNAHVKRLEMRL